MLLEEIKDLPKRRNFVAKHAHTGGAGKHTAKKGEKAPRVRQKRDWKKDISKYT